MKRQIQTALFSVKYFAHVLPFKHRNPNCLNNLNPTTMAVTLAVNALDDAKAQNVLVLDVKSLTNIADNMIICSGSSDRHVAALAKQVIDALLKQGIKASSIEGQETKEWILIDYFDLIIHIMKAETRAIYNLEGLWDKNLAPEQQAPGELLTATG